MFGFCSNLWEGTKAVAARCTDAVVAGAKAVGKTAGAVLVGGGLLLGASGVAHATDTHVADPTQTAAPSATDIVGMLTTNLYPMMWVVFGIGITFGAIYWAYHSIKRQGMKRA